MKHYNKGRPTSLRRPPKERFFGHVNKTAECWEWTAQTMKNGYGVFFPGYAVLPRPKNTPKVLAHRWSYEYHRGPIPEGHEVHHLCGKRNCVNPDHLITMPRSQHNLQPGHCGQLNATKTHCPQGHEYGEKRRCKICDRRRARAKFRRNHPDAPVRPWRLLDV
jgi:hypothetical protein